MIIFDSKIAARTLIFKLKPPSKIINMLKKTATAQQFKGQKLIMKTVNKLKHKLKNLI